jgi:hypothetical protein
MPSTPNLSACRFPKGEIAMPHRMLAAKPDQRPDLRCWLLASTMTALSGQVYAQNVVVQLPCAARADIHTAQNRTNPCPPPSSSALVASSETNPDLPRPPVSAAIVHLPNPSYSADLPLAMSSGDKARFYFHRIWNLGSVLGPAVEASAVMASPPNGYPGDWRQGAAAFGRNYGAVLGRAQTGEVSRFAAGVALREDPRYYPSPNRNIAGRVFHALGFTLADHSDSGYTRPAFANLIGAAAGGFVGDAYLPSNYTDLRHAGVRTGFQMATFAVHNVVDEFAPEMEKLTNALKLRAHGGS